MRSFLEIRLAGKNGYTFFAYLWRLESIAQKTISKRFCKGARVLSGRRFESGQTVRPDEITAWLKTIQKENE